MLFTVLTLVKGCKTYSFALCWQKKKRERKPTKERAKKKSSLYNFSSGQEKRNYFFLKLWFRFFLAQLKFKSERCKQSRAEQHHSLLPQSLKRQLPQEGAILDRRQQLAITKSSSRYPKSIARHRRRSNR